jgi:lysophospholipase L1-like esterase
MIKKADFRARLALLTGLGALALGAAPAQAEWITTWSAAPVRPISGTPFLAAPSYRNQTLVQKLRIAAGGKAVRLRLTNAYGEKPLEIGGVRISLVDKEGKEVAGTAHMLTFAGREKTTIATRAPILSDTVAMTVPDLAKMKVEIYVPGETGPCTCHQTGAEDMLVSPEGDWLGKEFTPAQTAQNRPFLGDVEVDAASGAGTIAMMADSITDGVGASKGNDKRWPDQLADRLLRAQPGKWGIANQGISGNRVISDGMGDSALSRIDRDIFALPGVKYIVVLEGVNDLGIAFGAPRQPQGGNGAAPNLAAVLPSNPIDLDIMLAGYRQIIERAHAKGIKVIGATIAPYKGATYWTEDGEKVRQGINAAIRSGKLFDGYVDFDKAWSDPKDPAAPRDGFHFGDHLHGTDAGYKAFADAFDLKMFK